MDKKAFVEYLLKMKYLTQEQLKVCIEASTSQRIPLLQMLQKKQYFTADHLKLLIEEFKQHHQATIKASSSIESGVQTILSLPSIPESSTSSKKIFGKYELLEEIARGGMGVVYKARHLELDQVYALKVILSGHFASSEDISRFHQEAKLTAKLRHPNIVQIYDSGEGEGQHYLTMELVEGQTLKKYIAKKLPIRQGLRLFQKILEGLQVAHEQQIIHRDLKPTNIFVTHQGEPKIGDFGLAKEINSNRDSHQLTKTGDIIGTPAYMAPEQAMGAIRELDARSDVYSMGACLYEILTQHCPFEANTLHELLYKIVSEDPKPPSQFNKEIHRDLDTIVLKALEKGKEKRYTSANEFRKDIGRFLDGYSILAKPASRLERSIKWFKRNKTLSIVLFAFLFLSFAFPSYLWLSRKIERNNQFQNVYQEGKKEREKAEQLAPHQLYEKIQSLLKSIHYLNSALSIKASREVEEEKFKVGEQLIEFACNAENYLLAEYVSGELQSISFRKKEIADLKTKIEDAKTKVLKQHLQRLNYWKEQLNKIQLAPRMRENALFEIAKMQEQEIYKELLSILQEGLHYFLSDQTRSSRKDEYYKTMVDALGGIENPKSAPFLKEAIEQISNNLIETKINSPSLEKIHYLVALINALAHLKQKDSILFVEQIRQKFGNDHLFWIQCFPIYKELLELEDLDASFPKSAKEYYQRGLKKYAKGDLKGALLDYNQAIQLHPQTPEFYNSRGQLKKLQKDLEGAMNDYNQALQISPQFAPAYSNRGSLKATKQDFEGAIFDYTQAITINPQYVETYNNRGNAKLGQGNLEGAIFDYTQALALNPQFIDAYSNRGNAKYIKGDFVGAISDYTQAIILNPQFALAYNNRGGAKMSQEDFEGAMNDYNQAIALDPQLSNAYSNRAQLKNIKKDYEGSILDYTQSLSLDPQNSINYNDRGKIKYTIQDYAGAISDFTQAITLDPKFTEAYNNRGYTKDTQGDYESAISDYTQAITLDAQDVTLYYKRGLSRWKKKTKKSQEEAKNDFQYVLQQTKNSKNSQMLQMQQEIYQLLPELK